MPVTKGEHSFPVRLLTAALTLTIVAILWASGTSFYMNHKMTTQIQQNLEVSQMSNHVVHIDTVIARALRMATTTGDAKWETIYQNNVRLSNEIIKKLEAATMSLEAEDKDKSVNLYNLVQKIDKSTDFFLGALEDKALTLVRAGKREEARILLDSPEYTVRKQDYSDEVYILAANANSALAATLTSLSHTVSYTLYLGIVVIILLPSTWFLAFRSIRRWRDELEHARKTLLDNEQQMQLFIGEIEMSQTAAIKAREAAEKAKEIAEKANATKSEFLANMSHELRTPLNSILGMLRLLKEGNLPEEELNLADTAFHSSTNLLKIVNDILDLSKIEAGEMQLERIGIDLDYALQSVVLSLGHVAREKHIGLYLHKTEPPLPFVLSDPTRFVRVLTNLVGNAIKYTHEGQVDVRPSYKKLDDTHIEYRCEVTDTGIGIPKEKYHTVFEKFTQADTSTTRKYGGTGLGLAITKQLVELMGGTIGLTSEVGVGSTFWFTMPFEITDKLSEEKYRRRKKMHAGTIFPEHARILVAEDHPMNQILMKKLLARFGIGSFEIADNGVVAQQRYEATHWDIILMDCHMPEQNGYDTTKAIRDLEKETGGHVPIIAMTANAMIGDRERCLRYGMDEYLSKPVDIDELKEVLGQWILFKELGDSGTLSPSHSQGDAESHVPVDLSMLKTFSEGDIDMEKSLIHVFVEQSDKNIKTLSEYRAQSDVQAWQDAAHMLKGGAGGIGAKLLAELCNEGQHFTGNVTEQAALFEKINAEYIRVKEYLGKIELLA